MCVWACACVLGWTLESKGLFQPQMEKMMAVRKINAHFNPHPFKTNFIFSSLYCTENKAIKSFKDVINAGLTLKTRLIHRWGLRDANRWLAVSASVYARYLYNSPDLYEICCLFSWSTDDDDVFFFL